MLRDYQQAAHDAAINWVRKSTEPCVIEAATGAGKSHIIAAIAETLHKMSGGKHVLCLQPSSELVTQNREKFLSTGKPASIFSSSAGGKCLKHPVVFGTPGTVKNAISRFGSRFALIIIDECHGITPTIIKIIDAIRLVNDKVRVIGLSATPYRLGSGYIYSMDENGKPTGENSCKNPYFLAKVYTVRAHELIDRGYLTPPVIGATGVHYEASSLQLNKLHKFDAKEVEKAFVGQGRLTSQIVAEVVHNSIDKKGVMLFAVTIQHAQEILDSLPPGNSRMLTGKTNKTDRRCLINDFKMQRYKYIVSVGTLTTGFDACHVDHVAILRAMESIGLLQQIIGRGLRISEGKQFCLLSDYGQNIERHCPDGDIFSPEIKASFRGEGSGAVNAECPDCGIENTFSARKNEEGYEYDQYGYFVDLDNNRIETEFGPIPSHHGRRCAGLHKASGGNYSQCSYRWSSKLCPNCNAHNDIAARYCVECKGEIIDPNEKLHMEFRQLKRDPTRSQTDNVVSWNVVNTMSQKGAPTIRIDWKTEHRKFSTWHNPDQQGGNSFRDKLRDQYEKLKEVTAGFEIMPKTVTYQKNTDNSFYNLHGLNGPVDEDLSL